MIIFKRVLMTKEIATMLADLEMYEGTYKHSTLKQAYLDAQNGKRVIISGLVKPSVGCAILVEYLNTASFSVYIKPLYRNNRQADTLVEQFGKVLPYTIPNSTVVLQEPVTKLVRRHITRWNNIDVDIIPRIQE